MKSIGDMIKSLAKLIICNELPSADAGLIRPLITKSDCGVFTTDLTDKQVELVDTIFRKHFA